MQRWRSLETAFPVHTASGKIKNATIARHVEFAFEENSGR